MGRTENMQRYRRKHKIKLSSQAKLKRRIRILTRKYVPIPFGEKCALCHSKFAVERHHLDYTKPFEVLFLCYGCHRKI